MTEHCSKNIMPDSITGMVFAAEGIDHTVVLLNGPMGCKFYHSTTSQFLRIRPVLYLPSESGEKVPVDYNYLNSWFFRQQRVPCTYLDGYDYVYGTEEKVREGLKFLRDHVDFSLLVIINSPGASLIGDQLESLAGEVLPGKPCVVLESPGFSQDYSYGFREASLRLVKYAASGADGRMAEKRPGTVNVLGLSIWDRYYDGDRAEIARVLELCGLTVNCFLCAGCSWEELRQLPAADLNLVLDPCRGLLCAQYLEEQYGMPFCISSGLPVGFDAVEKLGRELSRLLGTDCGRLLEESERARALAWYKINGIYEMYGKPKGAAFAVEGNACQVYAYSRFFIKYLGMAPDCLAVTEDAPPSLLEEIRSLCAEAERALGRDIMETEAELVFADANTIAALMTTGHVFCGIEISLPGMGYTDVIPKTHLGIQGALFLTEQVLNGLMSKL